MRDEQRHGLARGLTNYGDAEFALYLRRSFMKSMGYGDAMLERPIVGICHTPSGFNNCHRHFPELLEAVKRGVMAAGALPVPFPVISLGEVFLSPTSMKYRNLMSMDVEEMVRAQPMDAVVLMGGCDKTVPAQLMGAVSAGKPAAMLVAGPMMTGRYRGERLGACTDCRRFWGRFRAGELDAGEIAAVENNLAVTAGTCAVMGTASTMACVSEALGIAVAGSATAPAAHADRLRVAEQTGFLVASGLGGIPPPAAFVTRASVENALRVVLAVSGSTNAIIHLQAVAGRAGVRFTMDDLNRLSDETPVLVDLKPVGRGYMEDLHAAGGVNAILRELSPLLHLDVPVIEGGSLGDRLAASGAAFQDGLTVRPFGDPIDPKGGLVGLTGTLAPGGALLKRAAATPELLEHEGRAVVFSSLEDLAARIDDPALDVDAADILVLQNAGPRSAAGMPEAGYLPIPKKLMARGVRDMLRISDARMSGTAFGSVVLHVTPEATDGGPLALVQTGDRIRLSSSARRIDLLVTDEELERRRAGFSRPPLEHRRGYQQLYARSVLSATEGCDFDFLLPEGSGEGESA